MLTITPTITPTLFTDITDTLARHAITLTITRKRVKNINFRIKVNTLKVSAPYYARDEDIIKALAKRLDWIVKAHQDLINKQQASFHTGTNSNTQTDFNTQTNPTLPKPLILWGQPQTDNVTEKERLQIYRTQLKAVMPSLFDKWQPIVGKTANEQRIKKMKTRWGSCNSRAKRIWLSVYLPEYPLECTEYVIVHELCHLHHANHSPAFWAEVAKAMPDYQKWHNVLK